MFENKQFNIFETLEKDDKELIHSSFLSFLMQNYIDIYSELFNIDVDFENFKTIKIKTEHFLPKKIGRLDIYAFNDKIKIVIETKFKSFPTAEQLELYDNFFDLSTKKILIVFDKTLNYFKNPISSWKIIDYNDIISFCNKIISSKTENDNEKIIFITHYQKFLNEKYLTKFKQIKNNELDIKQILSNGGTFWNLIVYELVKLEIQERLTTDFDVKTFAGRQLTPGLNIWIKNLKFKPFGSIQTEIWYELQNNLIKLKFWKNAYKDRESLINKMITKGFNKDGFAKKGSKKNPESFTLYQKPLDLSNLSIKNIAEQYIDFKNDIELKMIE